MSTHSPIQRRAVELRGRRREIDALEELIEAVRAGESRVLVVRGEPGVGKTAMRSSRQIVDAARNAIASAISSGCDARRIGDAPESAATGRTA